MSTKLMCSGSERSSATSSRRSAGDRPGGGLVEQDQTRRAGQRHADLQLALLAMSQVAHQFAGQMVHAHAVQDVVGGPLRRMRRSGAQEAEAPAGDAAHGQEQVVAHAQFLEQQRRLVGAPQPLADALEGLQRGDVFTEEQDPPCSGREVAGDGVEQGGLAGAVGAEHRVLLTRGHAQRDIVHGAQRTEGARHAFEHQRVAAHQRLLRCRRGPACRCGAPWVQVADRGHGLRVSIRGRPERRASPSGTLPSSCPAAGRRCPPCVPPWSTGCPGCPLPLR